MLKNIKALQNQANSTLLNTYWKTVFTSTLLMIISFGTIYSTIYDFFTDLPDVYSDFHEHFLNGTQDMNFQIFAVLVTLIGGLLLLSALFKLLIAFFIENPIEIGVHHYMKKNIDARKSGKVADITYAFDNDYLKNVRIMIFRDLYIFLWTVLLIIPGIIKRYEYRLVSYLITDYPDATQEEIFQLSKKYMNGYKKEAFLIDLIFIPWHILGTITLGIVEIMYVQPYKELVDAAFYKKIFNLNEK